MQTLKRLLDWLNHARAMHTDPARRSAQAGTRRSAAWMGV